MNRVQGAVFVFSQIDGDYKTTGTTGFDGQISFQGNELPYGSYRVWEQSPPAGYQKDTHIETVEWTGEKDVLLTFEDVRDPTLIILKVNEKGESLEGAVMDVYADGKFITSVTTNSSGEARVEGIQKETYIEVVEKVAPDGHVLDRTSHGIHIDPYDPAIEDDPVLTVVNLSKPSLRIIKYDRTSGKNLPGVTFEIYKDAELFDTKTTPESGVIELFDLEPGTYLVKEVSSDDDHIVDTTPQQIELKAGQTATQELVFFNDKLPGMHLIKVDSADLSKPIPNAKFQFTAVDGSWGPEELTSGADGTIDLSKLPTGAMVVEELECPGYVIDDYQRIIELKANENVQFVFTNSKLPDLLLKKTSSDGSPLEGVSFRLARIEDGSHYLDRTTSATGEILWEGLEPGVYSLVETATKNDHILSLKEHHVELFPGKVSTVVLENHKRPNLIVYKNDADTGEPVEHTIFSVRAADGHSVDEIETDAQGRAELKNLLPGVYEITEKSVPSPWLKDAPSQLVTLYPDRDHTAYFKNHKRPIIEIIKENAVTFDPLAHVPFQLWYASNDTETGEFNDLGVFYTDEDGRIELDGTKMGTLGLRDGWFRVKELEPLKGFAKADPDTQEAFIPAGQGHTFRFRNQPLSAICVWKYDSQHPNVAIEGAVFQIRYLSGNTSGTGGTVIGTFKTSKNGSFRITGSHYKNSSADVTKPLNFVPAPLRRQLVQRQLDGALFRAGRAEVPHRDIVLPGRVDDPVVVFVGHGVDLEPHHVRPTDGVQVRQLLPVVEPGPGKQGLHSFAPAVVSSVHYHPPLHLPGQLHQRAAVLVLRVFLGPQMVKRLPELDQLGTVYLPALLGVPKLLPQTVRCTLRVVERAPQILHLSGQRLVLLLQSAATGCGLAGLHRLIGWLLGNRLLVFPVIVKQVDVFPAVPLTLGEVGHECRPGQLPGPLLLHPLPDKPSSQLVRGHPVPGQDHAGSQEEQLSLGEPPIQLQGLLPILCWILVVFIPQAIVWRTLLKQPRPGREIILGPGQMPEGADHDHGGQSVQIGQRIPLPLQQQIGRAQLIGDAGPIARQQLRRFPGAELLLYFGLRMADQVRGQHQEIDLRQLRAAVRLAERVTGPDQLLHKVRQIRTDSGLEAVVYLQGPVQIIQQ